ncbi:hypothetical protein Pmi06nite_18910 [Planotetraspora mira]|uniref:Uncharacterized protein n=1 Tax=Planotetraspora mira TaxID=58121 RepID=A0A8J3TLT3_9ACTN|nr:hypothetical protein Pmi06nite_18910 [Planotetraspora mira]
MRQIVPPRRLRTTVSTRIAATVRSHPPWISDALDSVGRGDLSGHPGQGYNLAFGVYARTRLFNPGDLHRCLEPITDRRQASGCLSSASAGT